MLAPVSKGPYRVKSVGNAGAQLIDTRTGATLSCSFQNMRKVNFEELLSFLPENFDSELAQTLELYRYKRAEPELEPVIEPETKTKK